MTGPSRLVEARYGTEPCPHCDGTGQRIVPPPPDKVGGDRSGRGRRHGYASTYSAGCRCELCRAAWREAARRRTLRRKKAS